MVVIVKCCRCRWMIFQAKDRFHNQLQQRQIFERCRFSRNSMNYNNWDWRCHFSKMCLQSVAFTPATQWRNQNSSRYSSDIGHLVKLMIHSTPIIGQCKSTHLVNVKSITTMIISKSAYFRMKVDHYIWHRTKQSANLHLIDTRWALWITSLLLHLKS